MSLVDFFTRPVPSSDVYADRLALELSWFSSPEQYEYLLTVQRIVQAVQDIPFIIRGSAASSLIVYLLGISNIDPIVYNIRPERFYHPRRRSLPDIDLDFPHNRRDEVFTRIYDLFPRRVARISNHPKYSEKSAIRKAVKILGHRNHLPRDFILSDVVQDTDAALRLASDLQDQVSGLPLHTGGIVVFSDSVPQDLLHLPHQIRLDKHEVKNRALMKIDILSNISLTQFHEISDIPADAYPPDDEKTSALLSSGDSFGITQAESPAFQKLLRALKPKNVNDVILATALIRPASAFRSHRQAFIDQYNASRTTDLLVYEDDATDLISRLTGLDFSASDELRRAFASQDTTITAELRSQLSATPTGQSIISDLEAFRSFSMCKSHSVSYGILIWALAYLKAHRPQDFWVSTLEHAKSMWRPWVHIEQAKRSGLKIFAGKRPFARSSDVLYPLGYTPSLFPPDPVYEFKKYSFWGGGGFYPGTYINYDYPQVHFCGLIGTYRVLKTKENNALTFATIGVASGEFLDIVIENAIDMSDISIIEGSGTLYQKHESITAKIDRFTAK